MPPPSDRRPFPDAAHEELATWVEETLADTQDSLWLVDVLFGLVEQLLAERDATADLLDAHRIRIDALHIRCDTAIDGMDALQQQVADLQARLERLEPAVFTPDPPEV